MYNRKGESDGKRQAVERYNVNLNKGHVKKDKLKRRTVMDEVKKVWT